MALAPKHLQCDVLSNDTHFGVSAKCDSLALFSVSDKPYGEPLRRGSVRRGEQMQITMATEAAMKVHDIYNYEFFLVAVCEITGFIVAISLVQHDAISIAHVLLDRNVFVFGPPKTLSVDEDRALSSKVMHYILDALKVDVKVVSAHNHGSLKTKCYIRTINNLITRQLTGKGKEWPLFVMSTCYAMNTFVSPTTGFSLYELVFLKKQPDLLNLYFAPLETVAKDF